MKRRHSPCRIASEKRRQREMGLLRPQKKRPAVAFEVRSLPELEKWRRQVLANFA